MKKDFGAKPWIMPQPVLIIGTYDENGVPDAMNAAWGGVGDDTQVFLCLSPGHKTVKNILAKKEFTVSFATADTIAACDYLGIASGNNDPDKFAKSGLHCHKAANVDAPVIEELPVCMECRLISYEPEHCHLFGEIVNTSVEESVLTGDKPDADKIKPMTFDICAAQYRPVGPATDKAWGVGKELMK